MYTALFQQIFQANKIKFIPVLNRIDDTSNVEWKHFLNKKKYIYKITCKYFDKIKTTYFVQN